MYLSIICAARGILWKKLETILNLNEEKKAKILELINKKMIDIGKIDKNIFFC